MRKPSEFETHPTSFTDAQQQGFFRAVCKHVVDGDTFDVFVDLGFGHYAYATIRLVGENGEPFDAPEINSGDAAEKARGQAARARVFSLIAGKPVLIRTYKDRETFGRFVAECLYDNLWSAGAGDDSPSWTQLADVLTIEGHTK